MTGIRKVLRFHTSGEKPSDSDSLVRPGTQIIDCDSSSEAIKLLSSDEIDGVLLGTSNGNSNRQEIISFFRNQQVLTGMPDGVVLIDSDTRVCWANQCLRNWISEKEAVGKKFHDLFSDLEIVGPDFCPFKTVNATGKPTRTFVRTQDNTYYQLHVARAFESNGTPVINSPGFLVVTIRDVTQEQTHANKLEAIHRAGLELADLKPDEVFEMGFEDRVELLKSNIIHYTSDLLNFNVVEVRLVESGSTRLETLLSEGISSEASKKELFARSNGNGVTGFVAATGKSYLCEDTAKDPLYIEGLEGARSSLTVPLILHESVIGTFNVESQEVDAFTEDDLRFVEIFARDVAVALNTLNLLAAQNANTAIENIQAINTAVGPPIDEILTQTVDVMDNFIGHDTEVKEKLSKVLNSAIQIKQLILNVGERMAPPESSNRSEFNPLLQGRHVLVVDEDISVRKDAHRLLEKQGCIVETAYRGSQALLILQNCTEKYDAIISDINLPDYRGYDFLMQLRTMIDNPPLVLMTGFGWDPGHQIVKARQAGLPQEAFLYKPFRVDQLLGTVEFMVRNYGNP